MKKIFKYNISPATCTNTILLPEGAQVLSVEEQYGEIVLYALVDPGAPTNLVPFRLFGTGHSIAEDISEHTFVGTVKLMSGTLMFHIFVGKGEDGEKTES